MPNPNVTSPVFCATLYNGMVSSATGNIMTWRPLRALSDFLAPIQMKAQMACRSFNGAAVSELIIRAHSFSRQILTNSAAYLVNSAAHRGKADEFPLLTAGTQLNFRGLIKS